jgi:hypothetical protein
LRIEREAMESMEEYIQCVEEDSRLDALEVRDEDDLD